MRRALALCSIAAMAVASAWSCSSFSEDGATAVDAGTDAGAPDAIAPGVDAGAPGDACADPAPPAPTAVAPTDVAPTLVATDGAHVYWAGPTRVERAAVAGGNVEIVAGPGGPFQALALTRDYYVFEFNTQILARSKVAPASSPLDYTTNWNVLLAGGDVDEAIGASNTGLYALTPAGTYRFLSRTGAPTAAATAGGLVAAVAKPDGGAEAMLQVVAATATDGTPTVLDAGAHRSSRVATDGTSVFFTDDVGGVARIDPASGTLTELAAAQPSPLGDVVVADNYVYFATPSGIRRVPKSGGCIQRMSAGPVTSLAVAGSKLYWVDGVSVLSTPAP